MQQWWMYLLRGYLRISMSDIRRNNFPLGEGIRETVSSLVGHVFSPLDHSRRPNQFADRENYRIMTNYAPITWSRDISEKLATPVKHFRQPIIFGSAKSYTYLQKSILGLRKIVNRKWEKNIIANQGLTKQDTYNNSQIIYGTLKQKPETERTEAISAYLYHKLKPKTTIHVN